ncbi:S1C family serine protease [Micromonospora sp. U21]|uniref:S1C family serine protease n=1 Tax=Micromonospora sp. U21 TaxID=2824899 RepID=UPI001B36152C|nr:S1C family serine protease [Micromonospora sp. U21]MBQ0900932.1 trypsin-like peptidase domain-containing protein [Micromonospora sp. U21]
MTAGFGSGDGRPAGTEPDHAGRAESAADRPGPLPPRIEPHPGAGSTWSAPTGGTDPSHVVPAPRAGWPAQPDTGQWGSPHAPHGTVPAAPPYGPAPGAAPHGSAPAPYGSVPVGPHGATAPYGAGAPTTATGAAAYQPAGPSFPGNPGPGLPGDGGYPPPSAPPFATAGYPGAPGQPGWPTAAPPPAARPTRRRWPALLATLAVVVLAAVAGVQAYQLDRLGDRLADTDRRLAQAQDGDGTRLDGLEKRAETLEKQAGAAFNPEAVASAVLPSVFRVRAGEFTGTAFAVGKPANGGGTNLFTNFHVIEAVWDGGGRQVFLERTDQRFPATIVKVDKANDVAQLRTSGKFTGLVTAPAAAKSGQQIVVVGAPLGLEDSVTTGVVSALRAAQGGSGPAIQFDAPINPGNSGGPVINGSKQVVGIATAKARDAEGIGLAVPIKVACDGFKIC